MTRLLSISDVVLGHRRPGHQQCQLAAMCRSPVTHRRPVQRRHGHPAPGRLRRCRTHSRVRAQAVFAEAGPRHERPGPDRQRQRHPGGQPRSRLTRRSVRPNWPAWPTPTSMPKAANNSTSSTNPTPGWRFTATASCWKNAPTRAAAPNTSTSGSANAPSTADCATGCSARRSSRWLMKEGIF
jgi:hypothetical protein